MANQGRVGDVPAAVRDFEHESHHWLVEAGFTHDPSEHDNHESFAAESDMHRGGAYAVHGVYTRGNVKVIVEENTDTRHEHGMKMTTTYPAVVIVESPKGRVACSATDPDLVLRMADELG